MAIDFSNIIRIFEAYGVLEFLLPFFLIFTILFAVFTKIKLFEGNKKFQLIIPLILTILVIAPHITGDYPVGYDPIDIINETLPSIALLIVAVVFLFILLGTFGLSNDVSGAGWIKNLIVILSLGFIIYIFGSSLGWWTDPGSIKLFSWWTDELSELLIILLVFGIIGMYITSDNKPGRVGSAVDKLLEKIGLGKPGEP